MAELSVCAVCLRTNIRHQVEGIREAELCGLMLQLSWTLRLQEKEIKRFCTRMQRVLVVDESKERRHFLTSVEGMARCVALVSTLKAVQSCSHMEPSSPTVPLPSVLAAACMH